MSDLPPVNGAPKTAFIQDGYTRNGYIAETEFYPACRFVYRPVTSLERRNISDEVNRETQLQGVDAGEQVLAKWMAKRVTKWDIADGAGHAVPITPGNMLRLVPTFSVRLLGILMDEQLNDRDPATGDRPPSEEDALKN